MQPPIQPLLDHPALATAPPTGRTVGNIHAIRDSIAQAARIRLREAAKARCLHGLEALADRKEETWRRVDRAVEQGSRKSYREAVALLIQLSDQVRHQQDEARF